MFRTISQTKLDKSPYLQKLSYNPYWEEVKRRVRMRDNYTCQHCHKKGYNEVHHKTYRVNGISIVGRELEHIEQLILLCGQCHKAEHNRLKKSSLS